MLFPSGGETTGCRRESSSSVGGCLVVAKQHTPMLTTVSNYQYLADNDALAVAKHCWCFLANRRLLHQNSLFSRQNLNKSLIATHLQYQQQQQQTTFPPAIGWLNVALYRYIFPIPHFGCNVADTGSVDLTMQAGGGLVLMSVAGWSKRNEGNEDRCYTL